MRNTSEIVSSSEGETIQLGRLIGKILKPGDTILLVGELGSGKTRLAKGIVSSATGVSPDEVVSPTFTLINRFEGEFPVHHADLYRVERGEIYGIGLEDALEEGGAVIVEWAEKIPEPEQDALKVFIYDVNLTDSRRIVLDRLQGGSWDLRMETVLEEWRRKKAWL
jgi:tRNA threonylcarbamoyladenosine biosynthesis protein TsaE